MGSIPYDPTLVLGQIVELERLENLEKLAEAEKPLELARQKMNNVIMTSYKLKMVETEIKNLGVSDSKLKSFREEMLKVKKSVSVSAIAYGKTALEVSKKVELIKNQMAQTTVSQSVESPLDYGASTVTQFPLSYDSLNFDVQYARNEDNTEGSGSHASQVSSMFAGSASSGIGSASGISVSSVNENVLKQTSDHSIEGTLVITARATHKNADIISPLVIDPIKGVEAWNAIYPDDELKTNPVSLFTTAMEGMKSKPSEQKSIKILSGCTRGSSFAGFVHIKKTESSSSSQTASSFASGLKGAMELNSWFNNSGGGYGNSKSFASSAQEMMSSSNLSTHCSLICKGLIPSIVASDVTTTIKKMELDPQQVMEQLSAIQEASDSGVNSTVESQSEASKMGGQFMSLNSEYMKNAVSTVSDLATENNKVIDTNSMMSAFEDFVTKAMEGESGVPMNFYFKNLTKSDIAKVYIRKFFPNGITTGAAAFRGQLGLAPEKKDGEEGGEGG